MPRDPATVGALLLEASCLLASKLDLGDLLRTILRLASEVTGSERASLFLLDEKTQSLYFDITLGLGEEVSGMRFPIGKGIVGAVAQDRKPSIINDVRADPRWSAAADKKTGFVTRSILAVPMCHQDKLLGVIEAINKVEGRFDEADVRTLEAFASQAAVAIENARLFCALREERAMLDAMFAHMTDGAVLTDREGSILLCNLAGRRLLGAETAQSLPDALAGMTVCPPLADALAGSAHEIEILREKPTRLVLTGLASPLTLSAPGGHGQGAAGVIWVFRDVTEERHKESLKRTFLSLMSHKLKTPLASITGYSEILLCDPPQGIAEPELRALKAINQQGRRLSSLVNKLLNFTTLESDDLSIKVSPLRAAALVEDAVSALQEWLDEMGGAVKLEVGDHALLGDRYLLIEVFKNLIENAVKFDPKPRKEVLVTAAEAGGTVSVAVRDSGAGIPPEDHDKVFSQFHQIEESFTGQMEGAGLGLPYVKKVVERLGGSIRLDSALGRGTTVFVTLPKAPA